MTDFAIKVNLNPTDAVGGALKVTKAIGDAKIAAKGFDDAIHKALAASPWEQGIKEATGMKRAVEGLSAVSKSFAGLGEQIKREADFLQEIRRPLEEYTRDIATLNSLYRQGKVTTEEYETEQKKLKNSIGDSSEKTADATLKYLKFKEMMNNMPGPIGNVSGQISLLSSGIVGMVSVVTGAVVILLSFGEAYINLTNSAQKFTSATQNVDQVLHEQLGISRELHSSLNETMNLYDAVRDATDELNMSHEAQIQLTKNVGASVIGSGKALSEAEGIMTKLTYAISAGSISSLELKGIFKQLPDVAAAFVEVTGKSRKELIALAKAGQFTGDLLIQSFNAIGPAMQEKVNKRVETGAQSFSHLKDEAVLLIGKVATSTEVFEGLKVVMDVLVGVVILTVEAVAALGTGLKGIWDATVWAAEGLDSAWNSFARWFDEDLIGASFDYIRDKIVGTETVVAEFDATSKGMFETFGEMSKLLLTNTSMVAGNSEAVDRLRASIGMLSIYEQQLKDNLESLDPVLAGSTKLFNDHIVKLKEAKDKLDSYNVALNPSVLKYYGASQKQIAELTLGQAKAAIEAENANKSYGDVVTRVKFAELDRADAMKQVKDAFAAGKISARAYREEMEQFSRGGGDGMFGKRGIKKSVKLSFESGAIADLEDNTDEAFAEYQRKVKASQGRTFDPVVSSAFDEQQKKWELNIRLAEQFGEQLDTIKDNVIKVVNEYDNFTQKSTDMVDGVNRSLSKIKMEAENTGTQIENLITGMYSNLEDTLFDFIQTGKLEWEDFISSALKDIERLLLKKAILGIGNAIGGAIPGLGFASGGSFTVGGAGGTDSQMVAFRASPGERVNVSTPSQQAQKSETRGSGDVHLRSVNVYDQSQALQVLGSPAGEKIVLNVIKKHSSIVRSVSNRK